jgi:DNA-directed RNA polymerase specialized sigma24 family protein
MKVNQPHDIIKFLTRVKERNSEEFRVLYRQGLSLREIGKRTGYSKSKVRSDLAAIGIAARDFSRGRTKKHDLTQEAA